MAPERVVIGDLNLAAEDLVGAREKEPGDPDVHFLIGLVHIVRRDFRSAVQALSEAVRLNPEFGAAYID